MNTPEDILKEYWGYDTFRPLQKEIISSVLSGQDTLALLPTGGGKSVCYQVPALTAEGLTLVISPLIALIQDQVTRLKQLNIPAACIHAGMHYNEVKATLDNAMHGAYKLLYISPERLQNHLFKDYLAEFEVSLIAVDEAHCISQWGHDFRPDYLKIVHLRAELPDVPVLGLTATATPEVQKEIVSHLMLRAPAIHKQSFARGNIFYEVRYSENKPADVFDNVNQSCSIIYTRSRRQAEATGKYLLQHGIAAIAYHAGMPKEKREMAQKEWMAGDMPVMAATTAFGMGIDKADVRMVLHYDAPEHLEAYYQEAGRAGRDGKGAHALALFNTTDIKRLTESIALKFPPEEYLRKIYQAVAEYLQIPIGAQPDKYYPFDIADFSRKFSFQPNQALPALKLLEQEGLWTLTDSVYHPATIQFITDRHTLDDLSKARPDLAYVAVGLLRMYSSIFHFPTPVRETAIARQLKISKDQLLAALELLHKMELLIYNRPSEGPQLFFHHYRVDSGHLIIDTNRINVLRKRHEERTRIMTGFLENTEVCRERIILSYFGEKPESDCGHCDVCRNKQLQGISSGHLRNELLQKIKTAGNPSINQLVDGYPSIVKDKAIGVIRNMIDDGILQIQANGAVAILQ